MTTRSLDRPIAGQPSAIATTDQEWRWLYKIGGIAALMTIAFIPLSIVAFAIWPPFPGTAVDLFAIIQQSRLAGMMSLDLMYLASSLFAVPIMLALYVSLKDADHSFAAIALALGLLAIVALIPARPIAEMLILSNQHAAATSAAERAGMVAAGDAVLALFHGTAFHFHYIVGTISLLISSFLMLRSPHYGRAAAYVGLITNMLVLGLYVPEIGVYLSILSVFPFMTIWFVQIARVLLRLSRPH